MWNFMVDFFCGGGAGAITGATVAVPEYMKVIRQANHKFIIRRNLHRLLHEFPQLFKSIPNFSAIFSMTCAIEFSVNERIKQQIDPIAGILSSAITGSAFLTLADHLMYRNCHYQQTFKVALKDITSKGFFALWAGFTPMVVREIFFISSVMHLGPYIGKVIQEFNKDSKDPYMLYSSTGRLLTGILTTFISQPFDNIARRMQINLKRGESTTWRTILKQAHEEYEKSKLESKGNKEFYPLWRGSVPRIGLATVGGMMVGAIFDKLKSQVVP